MSNFALTLHRGPDDASLASVGPAWITIDEAARRSGVSAGRLRGNCPVKYEPRGLARKDEAGKWTIREDADERFAAVRSAAVTRKADVELQAELLADPVQMAIAKSRHEILTDLDRRIDEDGRYARPRGVNDVIERFAAELTDRGVDVSGRTLKRWRARWTDGHRDLVALVDERRKAVVRASGNADEYEPYYEVLRGIFLDGNRLQKSVAIKAANALARKAEMPIPHDKMARRHLETLERDESAKVTRYRGGPSAFANKSLPYIPRDRSKLGTQMLDGSVRIGDLASDAWWVADHHVCDTIVEYEGKLVRPWLTAILDVRSNRIVGVYWSPAAPNKHNVLLALRDAIVRGGNVIPDVWYVDNGKDFDCWMFQGQTKAQRRRAAKDDDGYAIPMAHGRPSLPPGAMPMTKVKVRVDNGRDVAQGILQMLGIKTVHATPYNAKAKGALEGFFGIFERQFGKTTWTYCGSNPQTKPEHLESRLRNGGTMSFAQYVADAEEWIYRVHHRDPLTTRIDKGLSRDQVYAANRTSGRTLHDAGQLELLLKPIDKVKVTRMGVQHRGYRYHAPELAGHIGQHVALRVDPADLRSVGVWTLGMTSKIAQVASIELAPYGAVSADDVDSARTRVKEIVRAVKRVTDRGGVAYAGVAGNREHQLAVVRRRVADSQTVPTPPPTPDAMRMVHTPLDGSSSADQPTFRQAAGGEVFDLLAFGEEGI